MKRKRILKVLGLAAAALFLGGPAAQAETIYLKCTDASAREIGTFPIDLTNHTVGGLPAVITPISIEWDANNENADAHYSIDRETGIIIVRSTEHMPNRDIVMSPFRGSCAVVTAPVTKF
jgi:hypothetical protein